jgi:cell division protein FtsB
MLAKIKNAAGFLVALGVLVILFFPGYAKLRGLESKNRDLEVKIKQLKIENALLGQELKSIEDDPFYQEKIAREKMGVVRPGEVPIKIVPEKKKKR